MAEISVTTVQRIKKEKNSSVEGDKLPEVEDRKRLKRKYLKNLVYASFHSKFRKKKMFLKGRKGNLSQNGQLSRCLTAIRVRLMGSIITSDIRESRNPSDKT